SPGQAGINVAGANAIDSNAFFAVINGHSLGQRDDAAFGGAVTRAQRLHKKTIHRSHVDDASLGSPQSGEEELRAKENAAKIHRHFTVPFFFRSIFDGLIYLDGSVIEKHVHSPECF